MDTEETKMPVEETTDESDEQATAPETTETPATEAPAAE